ncbi:MAG TPA: PBSX family phage terminase large subunit, partial [Firmicutes bacterium]|nr:PBSX family phage terminase large subunit [Bacillota bacterium]
MRRIILQSNPVFHPVHISRCRYIVMKGSAGSGKSADTAQEYILRLLQERERNLLCIRKAEISNRYSTFAELSAAIRRMGVFDLFIVRESPMSIQCKNGSQILFRGMRNSVEREKLKSITVAQGKLTDIWIEEATELTQQDFEILDDRLRGELPAGLFYQIKLTFNPVSASHWIKRVFFDRYDP